MSRILGVTFTGNDDHCSTQYSVLVFSARIPRIQYSMFNVQYLIFSSQQQYCSIIAVILQYLAFSVALVRSGMVQGSGQRILLVCKISNLGFSCRRQGINPDMVT